MADNESPQLEAHPKQDKTIFLFGMIRIKKLDRVLIEESRSGFLKGDPMLSDVSLVFPSIPLKLKPIHMYTVHIMSGESR